MQYCIINLVFYGRLFVVVLNFFHSSLVTTEISEARILKTTFAVLAIIKWMPTNVQRNEHWMWKVTRRQWWFRDCDLNHSFVLFYSWNKIFTAYDSVKKIETSPIERKGNYFPSKPHHREDESQGQRLEITLL